ncbi:hypothetical protein [Streptomyces sp. NPDC060333]|uniref:hypothetical protein n=1 Tax=Streptomyces sp. NPDC060333 TaxID=3347098 RepID=UPI0036674A88
MVQALLLALLIMPFTAMTATPAHASPPDQNPFLTWNMQGATTVGVNLWTDYIPSVLREAGYPQIVMLQEVGAGPPAGAAQLPNPPGTQGNSLVTYVEWHSSMRPSNWYMLFLQTSNPTSPGGRVNTLIMSQSQITEAMVVNGHGRPAIGLQQGTDWYFSYHALSGGGTDAVHMLDAIGDSVEAAASPSSPPQRHDWTVGADFTIPPEAENGRGLSQHDDWPLINTPNGACPATPCGEPRGLVEAA